MSTYLDGQLVIADDLLLVQKLNLLTGGPITTPAAVDLSLVPGTGGITKVGAGTPGHLGTPTNNDAFFGGRVECDGVAYFDAQVRIESSIKLLDTVQMVLGSGNDANLLYSTAQTPNTLLMGLSSDSCALLICEKADVAVDFGFPQQPNPCVVIQSADATSPAQRIWHTHDQTDGVCNVETGDYLVNTPAQKTLRLGTVVWDDLKVPLTAKLQGVSNPPTFAQYKDDGSSSVGVFNWHFAVQAVAVNEEQLWFSRQMPHDYKEGTDILAHIHWTPKVSGNADEFVKWGLEYHWTDIGENFPNTTIIASDASAAGTATTSGDSTLTADEHYVTKIGTISGSGLKISSMLNCRIFRNSSDSDDDLAQDAVAFEVDFHYQKDTLGSRQEMVK